MEKVSVIIPAYNVADHIDRCLQSVLNQTYYNIEIIVVNDGSTDDTLEKCKNWKDKDKRIKIINQQNSGVSAARNVGLKSCTGQFISFIDSDDIVDMKLIEELRKSLKRSGKKIAVCSYSKFHENEELIVSNNESVCRNDLVLSKEEMMKSFVQNDNLVGNMLWNKLYDCTLFTNTQFTEGRIHEDEDIIYKLIDRGNGCVVISKVLYHYRIRNNSIIGTFNQERLAIFEIIRERLDFLGSRYPELVYKDKLNYYNLLLWYYINSNKLKDKENGKLIRRCLKNENHRVEFTRAELKNCSKRERFNLFLILHFTGFYSRLAGLRLSLKRI